MRRSNVTDIVHIEAQEGADSRFLELGFGLRQALHAQPIHVDSLFPIDLHLTKGFQSHIDFSISESRYFTNQCIAQRDCAAFVTVSGEGTVISSSAGEKGIGTSIAPMRCTGASR